MTKAELKDDLFAVAAAFMNCTFESSYGISHSLFLSFFLRTSFGIFLQINKMVDDCTADIY